MSGGNNNAATAANRAEKQRQQAIASTQARINQVFNDPNREADIADVEQAVQQLGQRDLDEQKADSDRALKFALARNGVIGGSTQNDQQKVLGREYGKGLLEVRRRGLETGSNLRAADQDARARLISLATSGLDATTAAQQSAAAMRSNLDSARSASTAAGFGDFFATTKSFADRARDSADRRRANRDAGFQLYGGTGSGYGGTN